MIFQDVINIKEVRHCFWVWVCQRKSNHGFKIRNKRNDYLFVTKEMIICSIHPSSSLEWSGVAATDWDKDMPWVSGMGPLHRRTYVSLQSTEMSLSNLELFS